MDVRVDKLNITEDMNMFQIEKDPNRGLFFTQPWGIKP